MPCVMQNVRVVDWNDSRSGLRPMLLFGRFLSLACDSAACFFPFHFSRSSRLASILACASRQTIPAVRHAQHHGSALSCSVSLGTLILGKNISLKGFSLESV